MNKLTSAIRLLLRPGDGERGSTAIEFGFIAPILVLITFAVLEFSLVLFEQHRANEATRRGARQAVIGAAIADLATLAPGIDVTCTSVGGAVDCGGIAVTSTATFNTILANMQAILPDITPEHVKIVYRDSGLGAIDSGGIKPFVTVSLNDYRYEFIVLGSLLGLPSEITLPDFAATEVPGGFAP